MPPVWVVLPTNQSNYYERLQNLSYIGFAPVLLGVYLCVDANGIRLN